MTTSAHGPLTARWTLVLSLFCLASTARAEEIFFEFEADFSASDGGGYMCGFFILDPTVTGEIPFWDVITDPGNSPFTAGDYYVGYPEFHHAFFDGFTLYITFNDGNDYREVFLDLSGIPDEPGEYTIQGGTSGEYVQNSQGSDVRFIPSSFTMYGFYASDAAPDDLYDEGGRLDEIAQAGDPVDLVTGAFTYSALLLRGMDSINPIEFEVFYDSDATETTGGTGIKWTHSYEWYLVGADEEQRIQVIRGDRAADYFDYLFDENGDVVIKPAFPQSRTKLDYDLSSDTFTYLNHEGQLFFFDGFGCLFAIEDRNGNRTTLEYEFQGLTAIQGPPPASHRVTFGYDLAGCIDLIDYDNGTMQVNLTYDVEGNLTSFSSPTNPALTTRLTYREIGFPHLLETGTAGTGPDDDVTFFTNVYDGTRVVRQRDALGNETRFQYEDLAEGSRTTVTDPMGTSFTRTFDAQSRIVAATNCAGEQFTWSYDTDGNLTRTTGPQGNRDLMYTDGGSVECLQNELGQMVDLDFENGQLRCITDTGFGQRFYEYDSAGNVTCARDQNGFETTFQHDSMGRLTRTTQRDGRVFRNQYNPRGELECIVTPTGDIRYDYDAMGRVSSITDQNGNTRSMEYDASGAISLYRDADGTERRFINDAFGRMMREETGDGATLEFERDARGDVTATIDAEGNRYDYQYDAMGRITAKRDPAGAQTTYARNQAGRINRVTDAMGNTARATYNSAGQKASITNPNGHTTRFEYDSLGRTTAETDPLGGITRTEYDARGSVSRVQTARGQSIEMDYDATGMVMSIDLPDNRIEFARDSQGRRTQVTQNSGTTSTIYDPGHGRVASRTDEFGNRVQYRYDAVGNLVELTYSDGLSVNYTYDDQNRMTSVTDWNGRTTSYAYDAGGNLERVTLPDGATVAYEFDACARLTSLVDRAANGEVNYSGEWEYDACGRTISATLDLPLDPRPEPRTNNFQINAANQIASLNGVPFDYDADGNLTRGMIDGGMVDLTYNAENRLMSAGSASHRYDPDGARIETTQGGVTTRQIWDTTSGTQRLLEEHDGSGTIQRRYVYGLGLISQEDASSRALRVYHFDRRGSTVALTGLNGSITDRYAYDPFGDCIEQSGGTPNPFTYNGRDGVIDDGEGLYFAMSRYYAPSLGRFVQREPLYRGSLTRPDSLNEYAFADNNPIDNIDPRGQFSFSAIGGAVGGFVGGAVQVVSNVSEGKPFYEDVAGAVVEGAVTGALATLNPVGAVAAAAGANVLGSAVNAGINLAAGQPANFDLEEVAENAAIAGGTTAVLGGLGKITPSPTSALKSLSRNGLSAGRSAALRQSNSAVRQVASLTFENVRDAYLGKGIEPLLQALPGHVVDALDTTDVMNSVLQRTENTGEIKIRDNAAGAWGIEPVAPSHNEYLTSQVGGFFGFSLNDADS